MAGMLQIITYLLAVYLIVKGVQVLMTALASSREERGGMIIGGVITLVVCVMAAAYFTTMQDQQATSMSRSMETPFSPL